MEEKGRGFLQGVPDLGGSNQWDREREFRGGGRRGEELPVVAAYVACGGCGGTGFGGREGGAGGIW
jgi:hypothetical protein